MCFMRTFLIVHVSLHPSIYPFITTFSYATCKRIICKRHSSSERVSSLEIYMGKYSEPLQISEHTPRVQTPSKYPKRHQKSIFTLFSSSCFQHQLKFHERKAKFTDQRALFLPEIVKS